MTEETNRVILLRIDNRLARLEERVSDVAEQVKKHDCDLNGNGKSGLKTDVRLLQDNMEDAKTGIKSWNIVNSLGAFAAVVLAIFLK